MDLESESKKNKIRDIENISFGENLREIISSLEILSVLFQIDEDKEVLEACKNKLDQGICLLKELGKKDLADKFTLE